MGCLTPLIIPPMSEAEVADSGGMISGVKHPISGQVNKVLDGLAPMFKQEDGNMPALAKSLGESLHKIQINAHAPKWTPEKPLYEGGLVPTQDGMHWCDPTTATE